MEKISKKEVRAIVANLIETSLLKVKLPEPSEKAKKSLVKLSKKISELLHDEIKKQAKKDKKALKAVDEAKLLKKKKDKKVKKVIVV
jgi:hypothetical protein